MNATRKIIIGSIMAGLIIGLVGCQASHPAPAPESVGALAAGPSVYSAPVHHDEPPALGGVAGTDDDEQSTNGQGDTSLDVLRREAEKAGAVEVAPKTDGVTTGEAR